MKILKRISFLLCGYPSINCYNKGCPWHDKNNKCKRWYDANERCLRFIDIKDEYKSKPREPLHN